MGKLKNLRDWFFGISFACVFRVLEGGGGVSGGDVQDFLINSLNT